MHAELLVDAFVRREERRSDADADGEPLPFFGEDEFGRYIGSSKPTCRLCALWFGDSNPDGTQVRPSHGNLYHNWRPADVLESDGLEVDGHRRAMMETMVKVLREETFRCIKSQSAIRNPFDSNNTPTDPLWNAGPTSSVAAMLGDLSIAEGSSAASSRESTPEDERREEAVRQCKASQYVLAQTGATGSGSTSAANGSNGKRAGKAIDLETDD